ncbi:hypothetical protein E2562_030474 [Oryza meyeriana var. granulata]|uniref:Uncharacterized protein n=1 Tax=Oryza meyeriana var. granulata TaxID=110450 RepID=A0A6G1CJT5_9ORYZ|nr:hypothetical protein E2562_030474 [Oryza meyeriana var. granulata]
MTHRRLRCAGFEDPSLEESDGEDIGVPAVGMVFNNHMEVNRFYRRVLLLLYTHNPPCWFTIL